jgi:hypothetical protein
VSNRIKWGIKNWNAGKFEQQKIYYYGWKIINIVGSGSPVQKPILLNRCQCQYVEEDHG